MLGIIAVVFAFITPLQIVGLICGIVGLVLGVKARKMQPSGMATAGFVLSIIGIILSLILLIVIVACAGMFVAGSLAMANMLG
ncbi:hypothetical protein [Christensenella intestinihominis]|uniref:hypothetical protein n=1 Tax=Christensenella intestinihominis TaxID=1851429 RepID=UPI001A9A3355|nr:hypothetical protein [Christensenella intestinihominis]